MSANNDYKTQINNENAMHILPSITAYNTHLSKRNSKNAHFSHLKKRKKIELFCSYSQFIYNLTLMCTLFILISICLCVYKKRLCFIFWETIVIYKYSKYIFGKYSNDKMHIHSWITILSRYKFQLVAFYCWINLCI